MFKPRVLSRRSACVAATRAASALSIAPPTLNTHERHSSSTALPKLRATTRTNVASCSPEASNASRPAFSYSLSSFSYASHVGSPREAKSARNASLSVRHNRPRVSQLRSKYARTSDVARLDAASKSASRSLIVGFAQTSSLNVKTYGSSSPSCGCGGVSKHVPSIHRVNAPGLSAASPASAARSLSASFKLGVGTMSGGFSRTWILNSGAAPGVTLGSRASNKTPRSSRLFSTSAFSAKNISRSQCR